jgi:hypothetical protein
MTTPLAWARRAQASLPIPFGSWQAENHGDTRCPVSIVDMACLLCGGRALGTRSATAEIELRCGVCGTYTITVGAVNVLRQSPGTGTLARAEVERRHAAGEALPRVDMELLDAVTKTGA